VLDLGEEEGFSAQVILSALAIGQDYCRVQRANDEEQVELISIAALSIAYRVNRLQDTSQRGRTAEEQTH
jgi:hypothetical protein